MNMEYVKNGISGQKRYVVNNNKVFDAKTGRHIYTVDNGVLRSAITGDIIANGSAFVSSGESIDLSFVTATENKILEGFVGADKDGGQVHGTIQTVTPTLTDNVFSVKKGFVPEDKEMSVPEMDKPSVSKNVVAIKTGYNRTEKTVTIPEAQITETDEKVTIGVGYNGTQKEYALQTGGATE